MRQSAMHSIVLSIRSYSHRFFSRDASLTWGIDQKRVYATLIVGLLVSVVRQFQGKGMGYADLAASSTSSSLIVFLPA